MGPNRLRQALVLKSKIIRRDFATGTRGARGHGWYINYRQGKGGRHLQGDYHDRETLEACQQWNESILKLGSTPIFMDIVLEPKKNNMQEDRVDFNSERPRHFEVVPPLEKLTGSKKRLVMDLASTVMPESTDNFIKLCQLENQGYKGSTLYRFEKNVGLCGGDVLTNTGKTGLPAPFQYSETDKNNPLLESAEPLRRTILNDPLAMWHIPGTVTMLVKRVNDIDSRYLLLTERSMHMDGIHRAIGQLRPESLAMIQEWHKVMLLGRGGVPASYHLVVADCGVWTESEDEKPAAA